MDAVFVEELSRGQSIPPENQTLMVQVAGRCIKGSVLVNSWDQEVCSSAVTVRAALADG